MKVNAMPIVKIEYDDVKIGISEITALAEAMHKIVSSVTKIEDVPVYAASTPIKVSISPIEIFVEISAHKVPDLDRTLESLKNTLQTWKIHTDFIHPINLTVTPMSWKYEIGI